MFNKFLVYVFDKVTCNTYFFICDFRENVSLIKIRVSKKNYFNLKQKFRKSNSFDEIFLLSIFFSVRYEFNPSLIVIAPMLPTKEILSTNILSP